MKSTFIVSALAIACSCPAFAQDSTAALVSICDRSAASPLDKSRPAGIDGVAPEKIDPNIAIPACEAAARAAPDDPRSQFQLGRAYGAAKRYESARAQYSKADETGYPLAANNLAALYLDGLGGPADLPRGMALLEKAAKAGVAIAMNGLAWRYYNGNGINKDLAVARKWFEGAGMAGLPEAMNKVGIMYYYGEGGSKDVTAAAKWYKWGAELGDGHAMSNLGHCFSDGEGVPQSYANARLWYERAAAAGIAPAMKSLGVLYEDGLGTRKNYVEARRWYEKAAGAGDVVGMAKLGYFNATGFGGVKDIGQARSWYEKAIAAGNKDPIVARNLQLLNHPVRESRRSRRGGSYRSSGSSARNNGPCMIYRPFGYGNVEVKSAGCY